jgi:hypothetical protein
MPATPTGAVSTATAAGGATFELIDVPPDATAPIVPGGAPVALCATVPGQDMILTFSGTAGQRVSVRVTDSTLTNAFVTLLRGSQNAHDFGGFGTSGSFFDTFTLPVTDTYTFHVDPSVTATGCATFTLTQV